VRSSQQFWAAGDNAFGTMAKGLKNAFTKFKKVGMTALKVAATVNPAASAALTRVQTAKARAKTTLAPLARKKVVAKSEGLKVAAAKRPRTKPVKRRNGAKMEGKLVKQVPERVKYISSTARHFHPDDILTAEQARMMVAHLQCDMLEHSIGNNLEMCTVYKTIPGGPLKRSINIYPKRGLKVLSNRPFFFSRGCIARICAALNAEAEKEFPPLMESIFGGPPLSDQEIKQAANNFIREHNEGKAVRLAEHLNRYERVTPRVTVAE